MSTPQSECFIFISGTSCEYGSYKFFQIWLPLFPNDAVVTFICFTYLRKSLTETFSEEISQHHKSLDQISAY